MSFFQWQGNGAGTKTDAKDGRNWLNESGSAYAQARYPGSIAGVLDDVVIDAALVTGAAAPTTNCDFTADAIWRSLRIGALYNGDVGASGGYLKIECQEVVLEAVAAGNVYLYGIGTNGLMNLVGLGGPASTKKIYLDGKLLSPRLLKGIYNINATAVISTSFIIGYVSNQSTDVTATIAAGATLPSEVVCSGGAITNSNAITTLTLSGGNWTQSAGDITTLTGNGGTLTWNGGNITTAYLYATTLDAESSTTERRVTDCYIYSSGSLKLDNGVGNVRIIGTVYDYGGLVDWAANTKLNRMMTAAIAGASDVKQGISPQTVNNASVSGDAIYLGKYDKLEVLCTIGAVAEAVTFKIEHDDNSGFSSAADVADKTAEFTGTDDNKTKLIELWGYEAAGPYFRITATAGAADCLLCAVCRKLSY